MVVNNCERRLLKVTVMLKSSIDSLTDKQRQFCRHYVANGGNASKAAKDAGYSNPDKVAYRVLANDKVQRYLADFVERNSMTAGEVLYRLSEVGRGSFADFVSFESNDKGEETGDVQLDLVKAKNAGKLGLIKELGFDKNGELKIKLHDAVKALQLLGQYHGLFSQSIKLEELRQGQGGGDDLLPMADLVKALQDADKVIEAEIVKHD